MSLFDSQIQEEIRIPECEIRTLQYEIRVRPLKALTSASQSQLAAHQKSIGTRTFVRGMMLGLIVCLSSRGRGRGRGRGRSRSCRWPTVRTAASGYGLSLRNMWTAPGGRPSSGGHRSVNQHSSWLASGCASSARTTPTAHPPPAARSRYRPVAAVRRSRCSLRRGDASTRSPGHDRSAIAAGERIPEC